MCPMQSVCAIYCLRLPSAFAPYTHLGYGVAYVRLKGGFRSYYLLKKCRIAQSIKLSKILTNSILVIGTNILKFSFSIRISPGKFPNHCRYFCPPQKINPDRSKMLPAMMSNFDIGGIRN